MRIPIGMVHDVPYVGPVVQGIGITLDAKEILETTTPVGTAKIIGGRLLGSCIPPEIYLGGKCIMFVGGVVASVSTGGNPLVVSGTLGSFRSIIKDF